MEDFFLSIIKTASSSSDVINCSVRGVRGGHPNYYLIDLLFSCAVIGAFLEGGISYRMFLRKSFWEKVGFIAGYDNRVDDFGDSTILVREVRLL